MYPHMWGDRTHTTRAKGVVFDGHGLNTSPTASCGNRAGLPPASPSIRLRLISLPADKGTDS